VSTDFAKKHTHARGRIRELLWDLRWHGHKELAEVGGVRYGGRVLELKREGFAIESQGGEDGKNYRLANHEQGEPQEKRVKAFLREDDAEKAVDGILTQAAQTAIADALGSFRHNKHKL